ncbi:DNA repair protein XRCC1 [Eufriesea mexicana]|uniref:DNA repair protein XRCC1 n=1 Tax=Eufriesea mexicana TaxID=516756 RepID=A0A310S975_9HYME|nr:PREDICTED: DNA repair protein XRCC1 [Eufriesea mexicana]OAD55003.1 DNA repair protein XRCC1 [Eufriesea mexicana]
MIIKLANVISCSSQHPSYPGSNLLQHHSNSSWRCAKPGEMLATVIFQLAEPSCIKGLDIGNYRSCVVVVTASTSLEPDNWIPIVNHQFLTHDEAANGKFRDQVQIFTKKDLNPDTLNIKFDRVKVTCMQSANLKELFGLSFIILKTEVVVDLGLDVFGRFKLKQPDDDNNKSLDDFKEKYKKMFDNKKTDYKDKLLTKVKEIGMNNFSKRQEENKEPMKRPLLEKLEAGKTEEVFGRKNKESNNITSINSSKDKDEKVANNKPLVRTPFGDIVPSPSSKTTKKDTKKNESQRQSTSSKKRSLSPEQNLSTENIYKKKQDCLQCQDESENKICNNCGRLPEPRIVARPERTVKKTATELQKPKKLFSKLFEDVSFSLSGYVNPQRDDIRRKALQMGAKYIANPNTTNKKCTHLICAFKNTPKYQQLKNHSKIVSHSFVEDCFNKKTRFPWRRYALDTKASTEPESEEEILSSSSPPRTFNVFDEDTDSDSNY